MRELHAGISRIRMSPDAGPGKSSRAKDFVPGQKTGHDKNVTVFRSHVVLESRKKEVDTIITGGEAGQLPTNIRERMQVALAIQNCRGRSNTGFEILFSEKTSMEDRVKKESELGLMIKKRIKIARGLNGHLPFVLNRMLSGEEITAPAEIKAGMEYFYRLYLEMVGRIIALDSSETAHGAYLHRIQHPTDVQLEIVSDLSLTDEAREGLAVMKNLTRFADPRLIAIFADLEKAKQAHSEEIIRDQASPPKNHPIPQPSEAEVAAMKARLDALKMGTDAVHKKRRVTDELRARFGDGN